MNTQPLPIINRPVPRDRVVVQLDDFLSSAGGDVAIAFELALKACASAHATHLSLSPRVYSVMPSSSFWDAHDGHITMEGVEDLTIEGNGAEILFSALKPAFLLRHCRRLLFKDLTIDWVIPIASRGKVIEDEEHGQVVRLDSASHVTAQTPWFMVVEYDFDRMRWKPNPVLQWVPKDVTLVAPNLIKSPDLSRFPVGADVLLKHYNCEGDAFFFFGPNDDLTFENITVYSTPGMAWHSHDAGSGFRFSQCRVMRRPGSDRAVSLALDVIHLGSSRGNVVVEDCYFADQVDDALNLHGKWWEVVRVIEPNKIEARYRRWSGPPNVDPGDTVLFRSGDDYRQLATCVVKSVAATTDSVTIELDQLPPGEINAGDFANNQSRMSSNFVIRRNQFIRAHARGVLIQTSRGLIEDNFFEGSLMEAIRIGTDVGSWFESAGGTDITIRRNTIVDCNQTPWDWTGYMPHPGAITVFACTPDGLSRECFNSDLLIAENCIVGTFGPAIFISSAARVTIHSNAIRNSNLHYASDAPSRLGVDLSLPVVVFRSVDVSVPETRGVAIWESV